MTFFTFSNIFISLINFMLSTITTLKAETPENEDTKRDICESKLHGK